MHRETWLVLPAEPGPRHLVTTKQLREMTGAEFDRAYVEAMVRDHEATVQLFESHTQGNSDPDAKAFAEKHLPTLRQHLDTIRRIRGNLR